MTYPLPLLKPVKQGLMVRLSSRGPYTPLTMELGLALDLERLLNTRLSLPDLDPAIARSFGHTTLAYGLKELTGLSPNNPDDCAAICHAVRRAIDTFEPRLQRVKVTVGQSTLGVNSMPLNIEGRLKSPLDNRVIKLSAELDLSSHMIRMLGHDG